jgi:predicted ArsR family transcriptional regulator
MDMSDRTDLLRKLGKSEFTVRQLADRTGLSVESARGRISKYLDDGLVVRTSDVLQYVDDEGRPMRGRPAHLYRVR